MIEKPLGTRLYRIMCLSRYGNDGRGYYKVGVLLTYKEKWKNRTVYLLLSQTLFLLTNLRSA